MYAYIISLKLKNAQKITHSKCIQNRNILFLTLFHLEFFYFNPRYIILYPVGTIIFFLFIQMTTPS